MATPVSNKSQSKTKMQDDSGFLDPECTSSPESEPEISLNKSFSKLTEGVLTYDEEQGNPVSPPDSNEPLLTSEPSPGQPLEGTNAVSTPLAHAMFTIGETMISEEEMSASGTSQMVGGVTEEPSKQELRSTLAEKCMLLSKLEKELETTTAQKDKAIVELAESRSKYDAEIASKNAEIKRLKKDVEHYKFLLSSVEQANSAEKAEYEAKIDDLKDELKDKEAEHEKEIAVLEKKIALNELQISKMETRESDLRCLLAEARTDAANAETKAANAETKAANAVTEAANAKAALAEEKMKVSEEKLRKSEETQKVEEEKRKAEEEKRKAEEEKRKAVEERLKKAEEKQKATENELRKSRTDMEELVRRMSSTASSASITDTPCDTPYDSQTSCGD